VLARWAAALERWLGVPSGQPAAIPLARIEIKHLRLEADVAAADTGLMALEQRLQRWVARVPGSK
jgi:hypothetical protein